MMNNRKIMDESRSIIYRIGACLLIVSSCLLMTTVSAVVVADKQITLLDEGGGVGSSSRSRRGLSGDFPIMVGHREKCKNEGEEFPMTTEFNCFKCVCLNGFVECESEQCPSVEDCYYLEKKKVGCCRRCKECHYNGTSYLSGTEWTDPDDPCLSYKCLAGVVTQANLQCYTPCSVPLRPKPDSGQCCPTCVGCKYNGQTVHEGREVTSSEDPCLKCQCKNRRLECTKKACPVLHCPITKQKKVPGECCPRCSEHRDVAYSIPGKCIMGKGFYNDGTKFTPDHCTTCVCHNGTSHCRKQTCKVLECPQMLQTMEPGDCCKKCPEVAELQSVCVYKNTTYQHDETWNMDSCRSCRCVNGRPNCAETKCPEVRCRANEVKKVHPGQCCAKCVESAGICTVFGDPHYKTFDGKFFSFQGMCKYQLTADCVGHTFSIRVTNDGRNTKSSSWTKTVTIKVNNLKVNLGQKMRVKVNGTRVELPYVLYTPTTTSSSTSPFNESLMETTTSNSIATTTTISPSLIMADEPTLTPEVEIRMTEEGVSVMTRIGVQLLWDGTNFLQVQAPVTYKNRLCGLCGNYNGMSRDDFRTRRGVNMNESSVWQFANSWRVGGIKTCSEKYNVNYGRHATCKYRRKGAMCRELQDADSIFGSCTDKLNPSNYLESCKKDMCECDSDLCFCDSFTAYAHECQRLGVHLADWRSITGCTLQAMRNGALVMPWNRFSSSSKTVGRLGGGGGTGRGVRGMEVTAGSKIRRVNRIKKPLEEQLLEDKIPAELKDVLIGNHAKPRKARPHHHLHHNHHHHNEQQHNEATNGLSSSSDLGGDLDGGRIGRQHQRRSRNRNNRLQRAKNGQRTPLPLMEE